MVNVFEILEEADKLKIFVLEQFFYKQITVRIQHDHVNFNNFIFRIKKTKNEIYNFK